MSTRGQLGDNREATREQLWPGSAGTIWRGVGEKGYCPSPRNLPLICALINDKAVCGALNASSVYVELLHRDMGEGIVEILDEDDHAYSVGYWSPRAVRTWRERVFALERAGFIKIARRGNRKIGYVLIVHPLIAVSELRKQDKVPAGWWQVFQERQRKVGGPIDHQPAKPEKALKVIHGAGAREPTRTATTTAHARDRRRR